MKYPWKQAGITGIIIGVFTVFSFTIFNNLNKQFTWGIQAATIRGLIGLLVLVILGIGIYSGLQSVKANNSGKLTYIQALFAGFTIALTTGTITAMAGFVYCKYINTGYTAYMINESKKAMAINGKSPSDIAAALPALKQQWSAAGQMLQALIGQSVCGTVISLILGGFIKSKK